MKNMPDADSTRRLAAVLFADVAGYSRMVAENEAATLAALRDLRRNVLEPAISKGGGRIVKHMGDGFLAEFASAVTAVTTACDLQHAVATANGNLPPDHQLRLRIGINLGDIVGEGDDITQAKFLGQHPCP